MESFNQKKDISPQEMGTSATEVFSGKSERMAISELYAESAETFADIIRERIQPRDEPYTLADLGSFKGELLKNILQELGSQYSFIKTGVDLSEDALVSNSTVENKVAADISKLPFSDNSFDISTARYVLVWNDADRQKKIVNEINRITSNLGILQHAGADRENTKEWQGKMHSLLNGSIDKIARNKYYFSSANEVELWMNEQNIKFECNQDRRVDNVADVFIQRYQLSLEEAQKIIEKLGEKNYIYQTTWVIHK
ncbi:MAG: hypothetical protein COV70_02125 [Parcubacteria group bacterium CG11_big_fil_rev_8_21_14_0_20_39_22]|nr:MAG: hypothetical protein COV70_02125 [Parcubacteria group bacterium CG11_big_fil_rev_8_21_14_0_20_39_22]